MNIGQTYDMAPPLEAWFDVNLFVKKLTQPAPSKAMAPPLPSALFYVN
jgi:hypothetical protein